MNKDHMKKEIWGWVKTFLLAFAIYFVLNFFVVNVKVNGLSMYPTYDDKDFLLVSRMAYRLDEPEFGDIVVFKVEKYHKHLIKRVIGVPGDKIKVHNGKVFVNDIEIKEDYIKDGITNGDLEIIVGKDEYFVMGDNRLGSKDSRFEDIGSVDKEDIVGKVTLRFFPNPQFAE